jgi:small GTP-binding protein
LPHAAFCADIGRVGDGLLERAEVTRREISATVPARSVKVCLLGDTAVGKTSLVRRFLENVFESRIAGAVGFKVNRKVVVVIADGDLVEVSMLIWDLAECEDFARVFTSYLRDAAGAVLVCDMTRPGTLDSLRAYAATMSRINPRARFVVAANKDDLAPHSDHAERQLRALAADLQASYFLTSAKTGEAVESLFRDLGRALVN